MPNCEACETVSQWAHPCYSWGTISEPLQPAYPKFKHLLVARSGSAPALPGLVSGPSRDNIIGEKDVKMPPKTVVCNAFSDGIHTDTLILVVF
jgi:hypothetical protein